MTRPASFQLILAALASSLGLGSLPALATPQQAQNSPTAAEKHASVPRKGLPGRRLAGSSRSSCEHGDMPLASIAPQSNLSLTSATQPKLMFYVADSSESRKAEFVLRDAEDREVYSTLMTVPAQAGFVTVDLAKDSNTAPLKQNENYQWYFSILCQPNNRAADLGVDGWIQSVSLGEQAKAKGLENLKPQSLAQLAPLERVNQLLSLGLWHDAMVSLSEIQRDPTVDARDRQQAQQQWQQLLSADPQLAMLADQEFTFLETQLTFNALAIAVGF